MQMAVPNGSGSESRPLSSSYPRLSPAAQGVHKDGKCVQMMLSHDRTFFKDAYGKTIMHVAAERGSVKCLRCVELLCLRNCPRLSDPTPPTPPHPTQAMRWLCAVTVSRTVTATGARRCTGQQLAPSR